MSEAITNLPAVSRARLPAVYSKAKEALSECSRIDECKDWADKAEALASYAKQAQDDQLRKMADRIQARAIRRCGELLGQIERATNRHDIRKSSSAAAGTGRSAAARRAGLSHRQQHTALRVGRIPQDEFEDAVESDDPPTITELAERGKLPAPLFNLHGRDPGDFQAATAAVGWIRTVNEFCERHRPKQIVSGLLPKELERKKHLVRQLRTITKWCGSLAVLVKKERG